MLPDSFAPKPDLSTASGLDGLRHNLVSIGSTPSPPAVGFSLGRASVWAQGMGERLLSMFSGQASGKWSVRFSRLLIFADACGLCRVFGGIPLPCHAQGSLEVMTERVRGRLIGINKFKLKNVG